ncbi:hypothetical protein [Parageobacillus thermoglucosidasius]|uniref:hypothetical protein n=1 Tax=Parageobacillus thermoglucosidasius TaxID=1426 RepID=UPI001F48F758|nr:hypothetical protein [Parageobacillus thermoglucosidasius]
MNAKGKPLIEYQPIPSKSNAKTGNIMSISFMRKKYMAENLPMTNRFKRNESLGLTSTLTASL